MLKPWRLGCLGAGLAIPAAVVFVIGLWGGPGILRWEPQDPGVIAAHYRDAMNDASAGDLAAALGGLEALRIADPFNGLVHAAIGEVHHRAGRLPEAIAATRAAVAVDPQFGEAWYNLACYAMEAGRPEAALQAVHQAVAAGFDARAAAESDPDLAPLEKDSRWMVYLEGADSVPLEARSAVLEVSPPNVLEGEPFTLSLELVALDRSLEEPTPAVSVEYLGPETDTTLTPVEVRTRLLEIDGVRRRHYVWTFRYRLIPRAEMVRRLGPWEVQLDGVRLAVTAPTVVVRPHPGGAGRSGETARTHAFRPRAFFRQPTPIRRREGITVQLLDGDSSARGGGDLAVTICSPSPDGAAPPSIVWEDDVPVLGYYDAWDESAGPGECYSRIFALAGTAGPISPGLRVRFEIDGKPHVAEVERAESGGGAESSPGRTSLPPRSR